MRRSYHVNQNGVEKFVRLQLCVKKTSCFDFAIEVHAKITLKAKK